MKVLVTGGSGFAGTHLVNYLEKQGDDVYVTSRNKTGKNIITLDLLKIDDIKNILQEYNFDKIFHLTAQSSVNISWKMPFTTLFDNINCTLNLLKAVNDLQLKTRIILASTCELYKATNEMITESHPIEPRNPYGYSKLVTDYLVTGISQDFKLNTTLLRLFNHIGPGQTDNFVLASFTKQIAEIKLGLKEPIMEVGNLDIRRDFVDVRDVCKAYHLVSTSDAYGQVYNVCSGNEYKLRDLLNLIIKISGLEVEVIVDPNRVRKVDIQTFYGSYKKINKMFGWEPEITIEQTLTDMYNWWLENLKN